MTDEIALSPDSQPEAVAPIPETVEPDGEADKGSAPAADTPDPNVTANGEKLDRATRNWRALERDRDHWREMAMRQSPPKADPVERPEPEAKPKTLADFEYDEAKYQAHLFERAEARAAAAAERKLKEYQERDTQTRRQSEFAAREREFAKSAADYYEVTRSQSLRITQDMVDAAAESEEAAAVLYYLGKNPDVTDRIASLSPLAAAREIGRIEAKLIAEREKVKAPVISKAPPPTPKLEAIEPAVDKDPDKLSDDEWMKWREKDVSRKRK